MFMLEPRRAAERRRLDVVRVYTSPQTANRINVRAVVGLTDD